VRGEATRRTPYGCARGAVRSCWPASVGLLRLLVVVSLVSALPALGDSPLDRESVDRFDTVVIDAGHGGEDEGAVGPTGLTEKDLVLELASRVATRLRAEGLRIVLTRHSDVFVPLEARTSIANDARADLFVSIHANASRTRKARGVETFFQALEASDEAASEVARRENAAFGAGDLQSGVAGPLPAILGDLMRNDSIRESNEFAKLAQAELSRADGTPSRGVKQASFVVLRGVQMPSSLIEIGFLTNAEDERALRSEARRDAIAEALARAVRTFGTRYDERRGVSARVRAPGALAGPGSR